MEALEEALPPLLLWFDSGQQLSTVAHFLPSPMGWEKNKMKVRFVDQDKVSLIGEAKPTPASKEKDFIQCFPLEERCLTNEW